MKVVHPGQAVRVLQSPSYSTAGPIPDSVYRVQCIVFRQSYFGTHISYELEGLPGDIDAAFCEEVPL